MAARTYTARQIIVDAQQVHAGGGVVVNDAGEVVAVLEGSGALRRRAEGELVDLGEGVLAPGWVNAHAHLELTGLEGRVEAGEAFPDWIRALLRERAGLTDSDFEDAVRDGAKLLLAGGTTTVGDVDSTGAATRVLAQHQLRAVVLREVLDLGDAARREELLAQVNAPLACGERLSFGISPHAGYTVSDELLSALGGAGEQPVQVHWNETKEEADWESGRSSAFDGLVMPSPEGATLERLDQAGLLRRPASLVHANYPGAGDASFLRERGVVIVHCPGAHAWFGRAPFDASRWMTEGVDVALGTDSLAGNEALDMRLEVAAFRDAHPGVGPERAFEAATRAGARALGMEGRVGELCIGAHADMVLYDCEGPALEALTSGQPQVQRVWVSGGEISLGTGCTQ